MKRHIIVTKFGNEPNVFGSSLRCGKIGDWETRKLLQILSKDKNNRICYYGKAIWDDKEAHKCFPNNNVIFIESSDDFISDLSMFTKLMRTQVFDCEAILRDNIDEIHVILGPHAFYNAGANIPSWDSIKSSIVTQRLLERVAPQIRVINSCPDAKVFFYLSDRRFLLQAADLKYSNRHVVLAQSIQMSKYSKPCLSSDDYTSLYESIMPVYPFRFETLMLYGQSYAAYRAKFLAAQYGFRKNDVLLVIPANQVTSDDNIGASRFYKIQSYTCNIPDYLVVGEWTHPEAKRRLTECSIRPQCLDGLDMPTYNKVLSRSEYALVLFNTGDCPPQFIDNWLTVKYWECVCNGCLTFVETTTGNLYKYIPRELQVANGAELYDRLKRCTTDKTYRHRLFQLQDSLVQKEFFSGRYFEDYLDNMRDIINATT